MDQKQDGSVKKSYRAIAVSSRKMGRWGREKGGKRRSTKRSSRGEIENRSLLVGDSQRGKISTSTSCSGIGPVGDDERCRVSEQGGRGTVEVAEKEGKTG